LSRTVDNGFFGRRAREARETGAAARFAERSAQNEQQRLHLVGKLVDETPEDFVERSLSLKRDRRTGVIVGSGPSRSELESLARRLDIQSSSPASGIKPSCPAFWRPPTLVVPSASETWGLVVNEAMACGLPAIVSSAVGCATDLVVDNCTATRSMSALIGALPCDGRRRRSTSDRCDAVS
jgi:glycosyltransferase involved in cell wall biosynthesis